MTVEEAIYKHSLSLPEKIALISTSGETVTYSKLWSEIEKAAGRLDSLGLKKKDRIILSATKSLDFIYIYFACHISGITVSPVDSEINLLRLERIKGCINPKYIIGELSHKGINSLLDFKSFHEIIPTDVKMVLPSSSDVADILFTTGTTGTPKGVMLTIENEKQAAENINTFIGNKQDDIELLALPLSHSFGLGRLRCVLMKGGTIVILGSFASMKKFYEAIDKYRITGFGMVPSSWAYISKMSGNKIADFSNQLNYIEIGSAPLSLEEKKRLMTLLPNTKICMHYGLTEASRSAFLSFHDEQDHIDSAGKAAPNCEITIFSPEGNELIPGEEGEVCIKGNHVCSGYISDNQNQYAKDFFKDHFRTGDWGYLDKDGYLHLKSRTKEMINVGGKKVSPMEVEEVLESYPGISEAACVGIQDSIMGEVVKAFIVGTLSKEEDAKVIEFVSKKLENYKVPSEIIHLSSLPKTESGKLQRFKLKEI